MVSIYPSFNLSVTADSVPAAFDIDISGAALSWSFPMCFDLPAAPWEFVVSLKTRRDADDLLLRSDWFDGVGFPTLIVFLHDISEHASLTRMPWQADIIVELAGAVVAVLHLHHEGYIHPASVDIASVL